MVKISLVSYLNSKPFAFGLTNTEIKESISLSLDPPSICAEKLINGDADAGLVPVAVIPQIPNGLIISDYCISSSGKVNSVLLLSNVPMNNIQKIILDKQSRTSVLLARILAMKLWKIDVSWEAEGPDEFVDLKDSTAAVVIGDRALVMREAFNFVYDLSEEWMKLTGLPFVFACWVANKKLDNAFLNSFNESLKFGVDHIDEIIKIEGLSISEKEYLQNTIEYQLSDKKREAVALYLKLINEI